MITRRPQTLLVMAEEHLGKLFDSSRWQRLDRLATLASPPHVTELDSATAAAALATAEVLITCWGCPPLTADVLDRAPALRAVLHAAGSVKTHVTDACWDRGLLVTTAADANAIPVAEFTLAAILFAGKRVLSSATHFAATHGLLRWDGRPRSNYQTTVGIVGWSRVGRRVAAQLRQHDIEVLVHDPYIDDDQVRQQGARLVDLDDLVQASDIVSLHAPALPSTHHLLDARRLGLMRDGATLVNTARGKLVDTAALTRECQSGRLFAMLDVTDPEPLPADSPLWRLPNVLLTPHLAGAQDGELHRLADSALLELERYAADLAPGHPVTREHLASSA